MVLAPTEIYTLSLHDALPISISGASSVGFGAVDQRVWATPPALFELKVGGFSLSVTWVANPSRNNCVQAAWKSPGGALARNVSWTSSGPSTFGAPRTAFISSISDNPPKSGRIIGWIVRYAPSV